MVDKYAYAVELLLCKEHGAAAALSAGFHAADGERIVTIDGDLQDNPAEIAALLAKIDEGFDVVSGWKRERRCGAEAGAKAGRDFGRWDIHAVAFGE